jgi:mono/diheme cytochrome c family protein
MFRRENYLPLVMAGAGLTFAILVTFQIYLWREPARLEQDTDRDLIAAVEAGQTIYGSHCASCHGEQGGGSIGPALNSKQLLSTASDDLLFSLIRTGVPGTAMPAWSQSFGGPLTDEEIRQAVAFVRAWEPEAIDIASEDPEPDPARGAEIFGSICFACHGTEGEGTERAPALNDPVRLATFNNGWYEETISLGRPSRGMPTWGTVLSPAQINDLVALISLWREGGTVSVEPIDPADGKTAETLYTTNCAGCHGPSGEGGVGPALVDSDFVASQNELELVQLISSGRPDTTMPPFEGRLSDQELAEIVALLQRWQP